jgi:hypothetical protein
VVLGSAGPACGSAVANAVVSVSVVFSGVAVTDSGSLLVCS